MKYLAIIFLLLALGCKSQSLSGNISPGSGNDGDGGVDGNPGVSGISFSKIYPINGSLWNSYIKNSTPSLGPYKQADVACDGSETPNHSACIHGGEKFKVTVDDASTCSGLSLTDSLSAFRWVCSESGGDVIFYSTGFVEGKGLADLITASGWRPAHVTLQTQTESISTQPTLWWSNTISALPDNSGGGDSVLDLTTPGTVYYIDSDTSSQGYNIAGDGISIVTLNNSRLSYAGSATNNCNYGNGENDGSNNRRCLISSGSQKFLWIEGFFENDGGTNDSQFGVHLHTTVFSRIHRVYSVNPATQGIRLNYVSNSKATYTTIANAVSNAGFEVNYTTGSMFYHISVSNSAQAFYNYFSSDNSYTKIMNSGSSYLFAMEGSDRLTVSHTTIANGSYMGFDFWGGNENTLHQALAVNIDPQAISVSGPSVDPVSNNTLSQIAVANNEVGINTNYGIDTKFSGIIMAGNSSNTDCASSNGTNPGINGSCVLSGNSDGTMLNGVIDLTASIVGKVTVDEASNGSDSNGTGAFPASSGLFDWTSFDSFFRGWGIDGSSFPNIDQRGRWSSASGRIWDFSLSSSDTQILNKSGDGLTTNEIVTNGGTCPIEVRGDKFTIDQQPTPQKYLLNAMEIILDDVGNDNGLCESNEACIYSPNIGAYQGHGDFWSNTCVFSDNGDSINNITGVSMHFYPINGN